MLRPLRHPLSFVQCRCKLASGGAGIKSELEPCSQGLILSVQSSLKHPSSALHSKLPSTHKMDMRVIRKIGFMMFHTNYVLPF